MSPGGSKVQKGAKSRRELLDINPKTQQNDAGMRCSRVLWNLQRGREGEF